MGDVVSWTVFIVIVGGCYTFIAINWYYTYREDESLRKEVLDALKNHVDADKIEHNLLHGRISKQGANLDNYRVSVAKEFVSKEDLKDAEIRINATLEGVRTDVANLNRSITNLVGAVNRLIGSRGATVNIDEYDQRRD
jgi:hypothetical protein